MNDAFCSSLRYEIEYYFNPDVQVSKGVVLFTTTCCLSLHYEIKYKFNTNLEV